MELKLKKTSLAHFQHYANAILTGPSDNGGRMHFGRSIVECSRADQVAQPPFWPWLGMGMAAIDKRLVKVKEKEKDK